MEEEIITPTASPNHHGVDMFKWLFRNRLTMHKQSQPEPPTHRNRPEKLKYITEHWLRDPWTTLSQEDIRMLWDAAYLSFEIDTPKNISQIRIVKHKQPSIIFPVPSIVSPKGEEVSAEAFLTLPNIPTPLVTMLDFLRPGDGLRLHWFRNALNNSVLDEAGLHGDMLSLHVIRDEWTHEFVIHHVIGRSDQERMIRPATRRPPDLRVVGPE